jgi:hypothetical protein
MKSMVERSLSLLVIASRETTPPGSAHVEMVKDRIPFSRVDSLCSTENSLYAYVDLTFCFETSPIPLYQDATGLSQL